MTNFVYLIPALPLLGFALLVLFGKRMGTKAGWLGFAAVAGAFGATVITWLGMLLRDQNFQQQTKKAFDWIHAGGLQIDVSFLVDPLSMTMALFVTGVSSLIHLYSIGYMKGDERFHQFFVYLNLFVFSMLMLVLADNLVLTFLGWEGVGACSYFLVGFWFERRSAASAAKKAFIVNRVGDAGLLLGMFLLLNSIGTLTYVGSQGFLQNLNLINSGTITAIALLLFVGAVGKSAQLPLFTWLPDAMEGPTPVSALIHAATMVTAGVYLMARVSPLLEFSSTAAEVVVIVGIVSALFAATVACAQNDIKRVLAYSTMSQLGYMFAAVGSGAYVGGVFHMVTHAFFKALMFLAAGSVIHALHDEQNLKNMGNLKKYMPITFGTFFIGWLAISGIPPFAGFWSKDEVLLGVWQYNKALWALGLLTVLLTAYYMSRLFFLTFYGKDRWDKKAAHTKKSEKATADTGHGKPHESPKVMWIPMAMLAVLSALGGLLNVALPGFDLVLEHFLQPVFALDEGHNSVETGTKVTLALVSAGVGALGILIAALVARGSKLWPEALEPGVLRRAWFVDYLYDLTFARGGRLLARVSAFFDDRAIDGAVDGSAKLVSGTGSLLRRVQTGYVRNYALGVASGAMLMLVWAVIRSVG